MDHPDLTVSNFMGNSIGTQMVNVKLPNDVGIGQMPHNASSDLGLTCSPKQIFIVFSH